MRHNPAAMRHLPAPSRGRRGARLGRPRRQQGVVLLVVLILLLLTTIVGYQVMETSTLEARMAVAREGKELSFQAAESVIDQAKNDEGILITAFVAGLAPGFPTWPQEPDYLPLPGDLTGSVEVRYIDEIPTLGNDLVIGNPGLRSLHFELRSAARRNDDRFDSEHIQGIKRFAPKLL